MPNVNDLNEFLTPSDVADGDTLVFVNEGEIIDRDYSPAKDGTDVKAVLQIGVELPNGKTKLVSPNRTSRDAIVQKYGPETSDWVNKSVKVNKLKQNVRGQIKDVIYLEPAE